MYDILVICKGKQFIMMKTMFTFRSLEMYQIFILCLMFG